MVHMPTEAEQLQRARRDAWQEAHDAFCDFATPGAPCGQHPNPYDAAN